ncbi:hypothetical protein [Peribacillus frigoritolerans]|uniref:hypothetical protein n=1 Tax=Peribacillus frigoritolerans TaxID=450367 RepID=UPI00315D859A
MLNTEFQQLLKCAPLCIVIYPHPLALFICQMVQNRLHTGTQQLEQEQILFTVQQIITPSHSPM